MRNRIARSRVALAGALVTVSLLGGLITATSSGATGSNFPWSDPNAAGSLIFYNASGQVITGGTFSGANDTLAAYVEGTYDPANTDNKATLYAFTPVINVAPGAWNGESLGASTRYPVSGAPSNIASLTLPVETGNGASDTSLGAYQSDFPNGDTSTTDGYKNLYVLRLVTSAPAPAGADATYDAAVIEVTNTGTNQGTWSVVTSDPWTTSSSTNVVLGVSNPGPITFGTSETLTATVTPAATGSVQFFSGTASLGSASVTNGVATLVTTTVPVGSDALTASFTPTGSSSSTATSGTVSLVVNAVSTPTPTKTKTSLKVGSKKITKGKADKLTATITPAATGKVTFYQGAKKIATVNVVRGSASVATKALKVGADAIKAVFTSSNAAKFTNSTSALIKVVVKK